MADEPNVESLQAEVSALRARIKELNDESKGHRLNAGEARKAADDARTEMERVAKEAADKVSTAEKAVKDAGERTTTALRDAALRLAAKDAGIVDVDGLKLLDTSAIKVGEDGAVAIPDDFFAKAKEAKPYLFAATGTQTGTTASTTTPPSPKSPDAVKRVQDMTPDERVAAAKALGIPL